MTRYSGIKNNNPELFSTHNGNQPFILQNKCHYEHIMRKEKRKIP
jgi:hypothetical protein